MFFASTKLVARIERAECRLLTDSARACARRHADADVHVQPIAGGVATHTGPGSPLNKLAGLGFEGPVEATELGAAELAFDQRDTPLKVELSTLADPSIAPLLTRRGYVLQGFENVLGRALGASDVIPASEEIAVRRSGDDEFARWLGIVVSAFAAPDTQGVPSRESFPRETLERVVGDMASAEGFVRYLARIGDETVGAGSMRLSEGVAQLCGAGTLPAFRRRGVQTALLRARLADAADAGCDVAVVTTQPGSKSMENVQRRSFELLYARAVLVREPD